MKKIILVSVLFCQGLLAAEHGVFMVVKGKVKIENSKANVEAKVGSKIEVGDTVVTENESRAKIVMTDRNIINISPNSKLKIEKYSNTASDKNVSLNLIEGKVRNNVEQKYDNKNSKFEVRTATAVAGVRGTQFITKFDGKSKSTEVVTLKGEVSLTIISNKGDNKTGKTVVVRKGEKSEVKEGSSKPAEPVKVPDSEMKSIDSDTTVKKDQPANAAKPEASKGNTDKAAAPPPAAADRPALDDLKNSNDQIKKGPVERKFDKSKVKIITSPN